MVGLLKGEYYKLIRTTSFWVIVCVLATIGAAMPFMEKMVVAQMEKMPQEERARMEGVVNEMPEGVSTGVQIQLQGLNPEAELNAINALQNIFKGNNLQLFVALFATLFLVVEFSTGSMKIIVSRGFARSRILTAKLLAICGANLLMVAIFAMANFLSSYRMFGMGEVPEGFAGDLLTMFFLQGIGVAAYSALALMVTVWIRSTALSIIVNVVVVSLGGNVFYLLDLVSRQRFHIMRYWVINATTEAADFALTGGQIARILTTLLVTFALSYTLGMATFRRVDVK